MLLDQVGIKPQTPWLKSLDGCTYDFRQTYSDRMALANSVDQAQVVQNAKTDHSL